MPKSEPTESYLRAFRAFQQKRAREAAANAGAEPVTCAPNTLVAQQPSPASPETKINAGPAEKPPARPAKADKPLPEPPSKVGGYATVSLPFGDKVTGTINYNFPQDFPTSSRDRIKIEEYAAAREFNEKINLAQWVREVSKQRRICSMRPVLVFCREAIQLHWGAHRIDSEIRAFVVSALIWAGLATYSEARREFEESDEWKQYLDLLLGLGHAALPSSAGVVSADGAAQPKSDAPKKRGRPTLFTREQLNKAREMKEAGKSNSAIAKGLYQTNTPTPAQRRSVPTELKHHFGPQKTGSKK